MLVVVPLVDADFAQIEGLGKLLDLCLGPFGAFFELSEKKCSLGFIQALLRDFLAHWLLVLS